MTELGLDDTVGILRQPGVRARHSSSGLGWERLYLSAQVEQPYRAAFDAAPTHLLILHLSGPVTVRRGQGADGRSRTIPAGGLFLQPAGRRLAVELRGRLDTIHAYLTDDALREANGGRPVGADRGARGQRSTRRAAHARAGGHAPLLGTFGPARTSTS